MLDLNMGHYTISFDPDAQKICTIILLWGYWITREGVKPLEKKRHPGKTHTHCSTLERANKRTEQQKEKT
eukprot:11320282-Ditylum_brightwellii.AAC.1